MNDRPSVKELNKQLLKAGRRICTKCGANKDLSEFYRHEYGWLNRCKRCVNKESNARMREHYHENKSVREKALERMRRFRLAHPEYNAQKMKEQHEREKRKRFAAKLYGDLDD